MGSSSLPLILSLSVSLYPCISLSDSLSFSLTLCVRLHVYVCVLFHFLSSSLFLSVSLSLYLHLSHSHSLFLNLNQSSTLSCYSPISYCLYSTPTTALWLSASSFYKFETHIHSLQFSFNFVYYIQYLFVIFATLHRTANSSRSESIQVSL